MPNVSRGPHLLDKIWYFKTLNKLKNCLLVSITFFLLNTILETINNDLIFVYFLPDHIFLKQSCSRSSRRRCSVKKVFLEISQNSQQMTCARVFGTGVFL